MILAQPIQAFAKYKRGCLTTREIASFSIFIRTPIGTWVSNIQFSQTCFSFETSSLKGLFLFRARLLLLQSNFSFPFAEGQTDC